MNCLSILVGFYMLIMGVTLIISSSLYRLSLVETEEKHGLSCSRGLASVSIISNYKGKDSNQNVHSGVPSCPNLSLWKIFAEAGIVSGSSYIIFILSQAIVVCCRRKAHLKNDELSETKPSKCVFCCSNWMVGVTTFLGLSIVSLGLTFIFLGKQLESILPADDAENKEARDYYPPVILYVFSIWHFVTLCGFCVWLGIIIFCPSCPSLTVRQCDEV